VFDRQRLVIGISIVVIVLGILLVGSVSSAAPPLAPEACAWVLWQIESRRFVLDDTPRKPSPLRAFEAYQACVEHARSLADLLGSDGKSTRIDLESQQNVTLYKDGGMVVSYVFKCFPHPLRPE
jgi:hypothetical protein